MSKRPSESNTHVPFKHIKPSSRLDDQEDQNGNQATSQDSGYSGSQGKAVQPMDLEEYGEQGSEADVSNSEYAGSRGQDVQLMDLDENSYQTAPCPEQGSDVVDGSSPSKGNMADILSGIRVDEDSNQDPYAEMMKRTNEKSRYFAENVLRCTVAIGPDAARQQKKEKKKRKKEPGLDDKDVETPQDLILKNACALLNSGGGVLVIKSADLQSLSENVVDNFWKTNERKLEGLLKSSSNYNEVFDLKLGSGQIQVGSEETQVDSDEILLFISAPQHFCSVEYNLYLAGDASVREANHDQTLKFLQMETAQGKRRKPSRVDVALECLPEVPRTLSCKEK